MEVCITPQLTELQRRKLEWFLQPILRDLEEIEPILSSIEVIEPIDFDIGTEKWSKAEKKFENADVGSDEQRAAYRKMIEKMEISYAVDATIEHFNDLKVPNDRKELILLVRRIVFLIGEKII